MNAEEPRHELLDFVRQTTAEINAEYERIRRRAREDPGTAGDEGEENWAQLLRRWLPATYHVVTKGRVLSSQGIASGQLDIVVLSPSYPVGLLAKKMYLAAGVVAAFQCKNTFRLRHLAEVLHAGIRLRQLMRDDDGVAHEPLYGLLAHAHDLTARAKAPEVSISEALSRADLRYVHDPRDCLDFLCIANIGSWVVMKAQIGSAYQTIYMGPLEVKFAHLQRSTPDPVGRFIASLLRRIGSTDEALAPISAYFDAVGVGGIGHGQPRAWDTAALPREALTLTW